MNSFHWVGGLTVGFVLFVVVIKLLVTGSTGACPVGLMPAGIQNSAVLVNVFFPVCRSSVSLKKAGFTGSFQSGRFIFS
jgi:hypothetical protein